MKPAFIGLDLETTGLDPHTDSILEVGVGFFDANLNLIHLTSQVIGYSLDRAMKNTHRMPTSVMEMHNKNGLISDMLDGGHPELDEVEKAMCALIDEYTDEQLPMLGASITFDRGFLDVHMPALHEKFHYRSLDATSVKSAALTQFNSDDHEEIAGYIDSGASVVRDSILQNDALFTATAKPHRAAYDIASSAGLILASMTMVQSLGEITSKR